MLSIWNVGIRAYAYFGDGRQVETENSYMFHILIYHPEDNHKYYFHLYSDVFFFFFYQNLSHEIQCEIFHLVSF